MTRLMFGADPVHHPGEGVEVRALRSRTCHETSFPSFCAPCAAHSFDPVWGAVR